jgi:hypothetical protein
MFFGKGKSKGREGKGKERELVNGAYKIYLILVFFLFIKNLIIFPIWVLCMELNVREYFLQYRVFP